MLLTMIKVTNPQGSVLELPLSDISSGYIVKDVEGLGPVKTSLVSSVFANADGEQYHSSRREARNLKIKLGLSPDYSLYSVHHLRSQLYQYFAPKTELKLTFRLFDKFATSVLNQQLDLDISGRVETLEPDLFTNDPSVDLSIMCFNPDLVDPRAIIFKGTTTHNLTETLLDYEGSSETGVIFRLLPRRIVPEFTIYHRTPSERLRTFHFTQQLTFLDELTVSSFYGNKYATLKRDGVERSVLYSITPQSDWFEIYPGPNHIRVQAAGDPVPYEIEYFNRYGGL